MDFGFWKDWKRVTKLEKQAIKSVKSARKIILKNIPQEEIIAIYLKGSFVRREMNKYSDVDLTTMLKRSKYVGKIKKLEKEYRKKFSPPIQLGSLSLWELKNNKRLKIRKNTGTAPSRVIEHLKNYKLIYGEPLNVESLPKGSHEKRLKNMIGIFNSWFLPDYKKGKFHIHEILKQIFWLIENEQKVLGKNPPHSWKKLTKSIKDKDHIVHDTFKLYFKTPHKSLEEKRAYIQKLERYLKKLEKFLTPSQTTKSL
ncbi:MAG: nucleotidyltransferase domain-containing protein [Nanoarchaeota archaeon]|nr:nucleotidyltransferase domain-containing protein [Nanoarchaeota archaeon]